ncbi:MAG: glycosyltransferase family 39 protein [Pseudomonadota bacterium]
MNELHKSRAFLWTVFSLFTLVWLAVLGYRTLVPPDESRYADMALAMWTSGDWVTPRLNGIIHVTDPPLQTWMNALAFGLFGAGEWQARLWTGLCGLGGIAITGHAGCKVFGQRAGVYAALVLASCFLWVGSGQVNSLDMGFAGMQALVLGALLIAQRDGASDAERRNWMLVCWTAMALSLLARGPEGVLMPLAVLLAYSLAARDLRLWRRLHALKGIFIVLAIGAPWVLLAARANPGLPLGPERLVALFDPEVRRAGSWYYYFIILLPGVVPWLGVLPQSLGLGLQREATRFRPRLMLLAWVGAIFLFLTLSTARSPGYVLPLLPAIALLTGLYFEAGERRSRVFASILTACIGLALLIFVPFMSSDYYPGGEAELLEAYQPWVLGAGFAALVGGAFAMLHARLLRRDLTVMTLALAGFLMTELIVLGFEPYGRQRAGIPMLPAIRAELTPATRFYAVGAFEASFPYELRHKLILVAYSDDFAFGQRQEPDKLIASLDTFRAQWRADAKAGVTSLALMRAELQAALAAEGLPMRVVARDARRIVVANR